MTDTLLCCRLLIFHHNQKNACVEIKTYHFGKRSRLLELQRHTSFICPYIFTQPSKSSSQGHLLHNSNQKYYFLFKKKNTMKYQCIMAGENMPSKIKCIRFYSTILITSFSWFICNQL